MIKIGLISDTHGFIDDKVLKYLKECNEVWHAGDIGSLDVIEQLDRIAIVKAVYGNIDGYDIRGIYPKTLNFITENVKTVITHIGGYPGKYEPGIKRYLKETKPKIFICGHSHILKVIYDKELNILHINPGAAGKYGFHTVRTLIRFIIDGKEIKNLEVIEIDR